MAKQFTLDKTQRLKSRKSIEFLFKEGRSYSKFPYKIVYTISNKTASSPPLQAGFTASSRNFKKAVDRNRIKRQMREAFRLQKLPLQEALLNTEKKMEIFFIYTGKELPVYDLLHTKMQGVLMTLLKTITDEKVA